MQKPIKDWENYLIDENGNVFSLRSNKYLTPNIDKYGYKYFVLSKNGIRKTVKSHRLVAENFIPNPENKPTVNHIDGNKQNNQISNLEWATNREQTHNPVTWDKLLKVYSKTDYKRMGAIRNFGRKPIRVTMGGMKIGDYFSLKEASENLGLNASKLSEIANGKRKHTKGYEAEWIQI